MRGLFSIFCIAFLVFGGCSRAKTSPEQQFWNWFKDHEEILFNFEKDRDRIFDQLGSEMHKLNPGLTFEFGPKEDGRREFVISADGIKDAFPAVEALYSAAPTLPHWRFIKFRPRRRPVDVSYEGVSVKADSVRVRIDPAGQIANLTVSIPGCTEVSGNSYRAVAFLFLDGALGEYDVETRVHQISVDGKPKESGRTYSLQLPAAFDAALARK